MKNFIVSNLDQSPTFKTKVIKLVEDSFQYQKQFSVEQDFYPVFQTDNSKNCHFLYNGNSQEVISHISVLEKQLIINNNNFSILLLGGVCTQKKYQGQGYNKILFDHVLKTNTEYPLIFLWSDLLTYYEKQGFYPFLFQKAIKTSSQVNSNFQKTKFKYLSKKEKQEIRQLYELKQNKYLMFNRTDNQWKDIDYMNSVDVYIKKVQGKIQSYFFMNKGMDLTNIIHEYYYDNQLDFFEILQYSELWGTHLELTSNSEEESIQFGALAKIGDTQIFKKLVYEYSNQQVKINSIDQDKQLIQYSINHRFETKDFKDFLQTVFGPYFNSDFIPSKPLFINGIDSI